MPEIVIVTLSLVACFFVSYAAYLEGRRNALYEVLMYVKLHSVGKKDTISFIKGKL